jgi:formylglycine-generating enzyme required for sulfatase activity/tetratricopeptide (TPR) repeat protein
VGRPVAIKVLNVQDDPVLVKRFKAEAMTSANLQHKNIVTIHEFGEDGGKQFLVMEYLEGRNLHLLIKEGTPLPALDKLLIMSEVCQGLEYAHKHGVVHRDVKPANIMRLSDGSVKIMDFGIARLVRDVNPRLTQTGYMIGTPPYMAPEQFASEAADAQCDIWAYGVVLYEFLSGTNPFDASSAPQVMYRVTTEDPPILSIPQQPAGLTPLLNKLLAKARKDRYSSMEEVRFDLELVIRELKQAHVESLSRSAEALIHEDRLDEALSVVRQILELDRSNVAAHGWRKELSGRIRMRSLKLRVKELVEQAEAEASARQYGTAADKLEEALGLDGDNSSIRRRMEEFRAEWEKIQRAAALVAEARMELDRQALTSAFEHASEAAAADPASAAARALIDEVRAAMERRELEARRKGALSKANGLILVQDYAAAAAVLRELAEQFPGDPEIQAKLEETKRLEAAYAAQLRVDAAVNESKEMIRRGSYQRAIDVLHGIDPRNPQVSGLLAYAREQLAAEAEAARQRDDERRAIRHMVEACRALLLAGNLDAAAARSAELAAKYPAGAGVAELREEVARQVRERDERRREAERLLEEQRAKGPAAPTADLSIPEIPLEPVIAQLPPKAPPELFGLTPGAPNTREPRQPFAQMPGPNGRRMFVIGACVLVAVVLAVALLRRASSGPPRTSPSTPASAPLKQNLAAVPSAPPPKAASEPKAVERKDNSITKTEVAAAIPKPAQPVLSAGSKGGGLPVVTPAPAPVAPPEPVKTVLRAGATRVNEKDGLKYVWIPPGTFTMGCSVGDAECFDQEKPAHQVTLTKGFWMGQTPVTQEVYQRVTGSNPSYFKGSQLPVETVTWNDAQSYCQSAGMRLPTEAEWEYAARGGSTGSRYGDLDRIAWYNINSGNTTHAVAQKQANAFGLYDMLGNVWQWVADWYAEYPAGTRRDPAGPASGQYRTLRGGSWAGYPRVARASGRGRGEPGYRVDGIGLRCAGN